MTNFTQTSLKYLSVHFTEAVTAETVGQAATFSKK